MTLDSSEWDEDLPADPEEEYQTFVRTLERTEGFRLLFVRCAPVEGEQLIARVKDDLPKKIIEFLPLDKPIDNLYKIVERLSNREQINILFIQGLEDSFYEYEQEKFGSANEEYFSSWQGAPRILNHLNQQRERFRDDFNICFVFLLQSFSIKYFIHRAPDFFDWRSNLFEFPTESGTLKRESSRIIQEGNIEKYITLNTKEIVKQILYIKELLQDQKVSRDRADLLLQLGDLYRAARKYTGAIHSYDQALKLNPDLHKAWNGWGNVLLALRRHEDAIVLYNQALRIQPNFYNAWYNRGISRSYLKDYKKAIASYDEALKIKSDFHPAWFYRGNVLAIIERYKKAIASYDEALKIKSDFNEAWFYRGNVLATIERYEEAIASYGEALKIKSDSHHTWFYQGNALANIGRYEDAIASYDKALEIQPNLHQAWYYRGNALLNLGRYEEAITSCDQSLKIQPNLHQAWYYRGNALLNLGCYEEAITSYDQSLKIQPNYHQALNDRGYALSKLEGYEVISSYEQALKMQPNYLNFWYNCVISLRELIWKKITKTLAIFLKFIDFRR